MSLLTFLRDNVRFLTAGVVLSFSSSYGQTYFIALFAAQFMGLFSLSDGQWGGVYSVSTTASAVVMFWAGALTDRYRVRLIAWVVFPALAVTCVAMALNAWLPTLFVVVFALRLFGQGMMSQLAVVAMARWFSARRGLALSITALGFAAGQALTPIVVASLLLFMDWRTVWLGAAAALLLTLPVVLTLLKAERTPQMLAKETSATGMGGRHWTRAEMLRSSFFWLLIPMLLGPPSWGTALFFQQVHIAGTKGWPLIEYVSLVPLLTIVSVTVMLVSGQLIDRFGTGRLILVFLFPWIGGFLVLGQAETLGEAAVAFLIFGMAMGLQATLITAFWAEYFGTRYIGAIKATSTSIMVFGSALGPGISGMMIDFGHPFPDQMVWIAGYFAVATGLVWIAVGRANRELPSSKVNIEGT